MSVEMTPGGSALSGTMFALLRLSSRLLAAGDLLVAGIGLTSARWQTLGTMVEAQRPQPVAWIARDMGASRQNVQRLVNDLERAGLVEFRPNPHHRRAQLVALTQKGEAAYRAALLVAAPWTNGLAEGLEIGDIEAARRVIDALRSKLAAEE